MSRILDKSFKYTPSHATDVRKTIRREQLRIKAEQEARAIKLAPLPARKAANGR